MTKTSSGVISLSAVPYGAAESFGVNFSPQFIFYLFPAAGQFLLKGKQNMERMLRSASMKP